MLSLLVVQPRLRPTSLLQLTQVILLCIIRLLRLLHPTLMQTLILTTMGMHTQMAQIVSSNNGDITTRGIHLITLIRMLMDMHMHMDHPRRIRRDLPMLMVAMAIQ